MRNFFKRPKPWYRKKRYIALGLVCAGLVAFRIALPEFVRKVANKRLSNFSPIVAGHIGDVDVAFFRGAYQTKDVRVWLKKDQRPFLKVGEIDVSIAWRMLLEGKILAEIVIVQLELDYSKQLLSELKKIPHHAVKKEKERAVRLDLELVEIKDSHVNLLDYPGLYKDESFVLSAINGRISNLTPTKDNPYSLYEVRTNIQGLTEVKSRGKMNLNSKPIEWDVDSELHELDLTALNEVLKDKVPITFKRGQLDFYAEAKSEDGKIVGYIKPFFQDLKFVGNKSDFKGVKHWFFDVSGALGNFILQNHKTDTVATKIPFEYTNKFKFDTGEALEKAIQNGFEKRLKPGIENKLQIK